MNRRSTLLHLDRTVTRSIHRGSVELRRHQFVRQRQSSTSSAEKVDLDELLEKPTWSVNALLPNKDSASEDLEHVSSKQLHHLLRLSALPPPEDDIEEKNMLSTLSSQLHFVREIQQVDTSNVRPLQSLQDETEEGRKINTIGLEQLREAFAEEELKGQYYKRIRRRQHDPSAGQDTKRWDVLGHAQKKVGRYFVVEGGKEG